jgi:pimeloyl-ACP methyl ester carboxylesterase
MWHYRETGTGRPLVLLHGIGMSHFVWSPVIPYLSPTRRVIAFDTAGFGLTPPLPQGTVPTVPRLVGELEQAMRELGIELPVDIAGNSLGGYMALEAARRGIARTAVAICPAGLWKEAPAPHVRYVFGASRFLATRFPGLLQRLVRVPISREAIFAVPVSVGSRRMPAGDAIRVVDDLAQSPGFEVTFEASRKPFAGTDITVPVTVAFGDRDYIVTQSSEWLQGLPAHTRRLRMGGWGHVPMWVDPAGVSRVILEGSADAGAPVWSEQSCGANRPLDVGGHYQRGSAF